MHKSRTPTVEHAGMHLARFVPCPIDDQPRTIQEMNQYGYPALVVRWGVYDLQAGEILWRANGQPFMLDSYYAAEVESDMQGNIITALEELSHPA